MSQHAPAVQDRPAFIEAFLAQTRLAPGPEPPQGRAPDLSTSVAVVCYASAFAIPVGTSFLDAVGGQPPDWWIYSEDGDSVMPDNPGALLFSECAPAVANCAIARLRPHSARSLRETLRAARYQEKPATYVISERDAILPPDVQKGIAALAQATTVSLGSDHHAMLSRPAELALTLAGIVAGTTHAEPATSAGSS